MSDCLRLSDRMPDVALGRSAWAPEEEAHLLACAECQAEWAVIGAAVGLGSRAPSPGDPAAMAAAIGRRLARERAERRDRARRWSVAGLAAAAAVTLVVWTRTPGRPPGAGTGPVPTAAGQALVPLPELELLEPAELDSLLDRMEAPVAGSSTLDAPTLGELEDTELEQVLATWEG